MRPHHLLLWCVLLLVTLLLLATGASELSGQAEDPLSDPLVLGAWLYEGNCVGCHGSYESARLASAATEEDLIEDIRGRSGGCQVTWDRRRGGPLGIRELRALAAYMLAWEDLGGPPDLPPLPPQPTPTATPAPVLQAAEASPTPEETVSEEVRVAIEGSPLALGAYLYTKNCHRCHQAYDRTRQGRGFTPAQVEKVIANGKTATSMEPFSRRKGGELTLREIRAIVTYIDAFELLNEEPALPAVLFTPPTPDPARLLPITPRQVPEVAGDAAAGAQLYAVHCVACHGADGEGGLGPALARPWYGLRPDLMIRATIQGGVPGSAMPVWGPISGGPLSDQQVDDLVVWILGWSER
jgi:mono/diheme cytochrome c family protein